MASGGKFAIMGNGAFKESWLFDIKACHRHVKPDFLNTSTKAKEGDTRLTGRDVAIGRLVIPPFGGNFPPTDNVEPAKKKRNFDQDIFGPSFLSRRRDVVAKRFLKEVR